MQAGSGYSEEDYRAMLAKIFKLQEENVLLQQKLQVRSWNILWTLRPKYT
jgi:hypothetical protein